MPDQSVFTTLIHEHRGLLYKAAALYTSTGEDREDLLQEIIYQLWKSFGSYAGKAEVSTWMYRVAMNVAIHHLKREKRRLPTSSLEQLATEPMDTTPEEDRWDQLRQHIAPLSRLEKGILFLYLEDKSYAEIGAIIGLSATNVGSKLTRIREKLRKNVTP